MSGKVSEEVFIELIRQLESLNTIHRLFGLQKSFQSTVPLK